MYNVSDKLRTISKLTSKQIYTNLLIKQIKPPTAINNWIESYPFLETIEWKDLYLLPYKTTNETNLHSFQYKILNKLTNCNEKLHLWKIKESNKCSYCNKIDNIEHFLFWCTQSRKIWTQLETWYQSVFEVKLNLTICEILFGITTIDSIEVKILNYIILITKFFIHKTKQQENNLYFIELLHYLKIKTETMLESNAITNKENKEWQEELMNAF